MKFLIISSVLAASQCMAEPSGTGPAATSKDVDGRLVQAQDAGSRAGSDAGHPTPAETAARLLSVGPPPFTVSTRRIDWPQAQVTLLAPQGSRVDGHGMSALVILGEGRNFAYHVSDSAVDAPDPTLLDSETGRVSDRDDGAVVWQDTDRWLFRVQRDGFTCWNGLDTDHGADDVEMMIASCLSIEAGKGAAQ